MFEGDVAAVAGERAMGRLRELGEGPVVLWVDQLAAALDAYFESLEAADGRGDA